MKLPIIACVLIFSLLLPACALSQNENALLNEAVRVALIYPEQFDSYVAANRTRFDSSFQDCMRSVYYEIAQESQRFSVECDRVRDPEQRPYNSACQTVDELTKLALLLDSMFYVIQGNGPYSDTPTGGAAMLGKQVLGKDRYEQLCAVSFQSYGIYLTCR